MPEVFPAVDSEHALIMAQQVTTEATDNRCLLPMAEAAQAAVSGPGQVLHVVADAGYSNGEQAEACEAKGILPHLPANRGVNNHGGGKLFDRSAFVYQPEQDRFVCPAGQTLKREQISRKDRSVYYAGRPEICGACPLQVPCGAAINRAPARSRMVLRHVGCHPQIPALRHKAVRVKGLLAQCVRNGAVSDQQNIDQKTQAALLALRDPGLLYYQGSIMAFAATRIWRCDCCAAPSRRTTVRLLLWILTHC